MKTLAAIAFVLSTSAAFGDPYDIYPFASRWRGTIGGVAVQLVDADHSGYFKTERQCRKHVDVVTPKMIALLRTQFGPESEINIVGACSLWRVK
jgi:hypothetical protein